MKISVRYVVFGTLYSSGNALMFQVPREYGRPSQFQVNDPEYSEMRGEIEKMFGTKFCTGILRVQAYSYEKPVFHEVELPAENVARLISLGGGKDLADVPELGCHIFKME